MAGKKEKVASSIAASTRSVSEAESDVPTPAAKNKKSELEETTAADAARLKAALKVKMLGGLRRRYSGAAATVAPQVPKV